MMRVLLVLLFWRVVSIISYLFKESPPKAYLLIISSFNKVLPISEPFVNPVGFATVQSIVFSFKIKSVITSSSYHRLLMGYDPLLN